MCPEEMLRGRDETNLDKSKKSDCCLHRPSFPRILLLTVMPYGIEQPSAQLGSPAPSQILVYWQTMASHVKHPLNVHDTRTEFI